MVSGIGNDSLASIPSMDIGGASTSRQEQQQGRRSSAGRGNGASTPAASADSLTLSPESQQQISKLQQRDREVRSHEQSHIAAGGAHVSGGAHYSYQRGPDNKQYAVGGSVSIDTSPVSGDPDATREKARQVRSAALAPSNPSAQDQSVAAQAASLETQAQQEENSQSVEEKKGENGPNAESDGLNANTSTRASASAPLNAPRPADFASRVAAAYQNMQQQAVTPTQLAPQGTGIAITV